MRFPAAIPGLLLAAMSTILVSAEPRRVPIHVQPVAMGYGIPDSVPAFLAEVEYDVSAEDVDGSTKVLGYEYPEMPEQGAEVVRVGVWDARQRRWASSVSMASAENFAKGYAPTFVLTVDVDAKGEDRVVGVAFKGVLIDAGQTRDFGPTAVVKVTGVGKQPDLNKPVVLAPGGKKVVEEEKTFLQKYWWVLAIGAMLLVTGGGGDEKK